MPRHYIKTFMGGVYDYDSPHTNNYDFKEIAIALSREQRFANHLRIKWSVAQHVLLVHKILLYYAVTTNELKIGIHHDDLEAYFKDIPTPLKTLIPDYKKIYNEHEAHYFKNVLDVKNYDKEMISRADYLAMIYEDVLFGTKGIDFHGFDLNKLVEIDNKDFNRQLIPYIDSLAPLTEEEIHDKLIKLYEHYK